MFGWFKHIFAGDALRWLARFFRTRQGVSAAEGAVTNVPKAMPWLVLAIDIATGLIHTPGEIDDAVWLVIKKNYPNLASIKSPTADESKLLAFVFASEGLSLDQGLSTSQARSAVSLGYSDLVLPPIPIPTPQHP